MKNFRKFALPLLGIGLVIAYSNQTHAFSKQDIPALPVVAATSSTSFGDLQRSKAAALDLALRSAVLQAGVPSMSAAIAQGGEIRWAGSYGWADIAGRELASPATRYRTGSMAKPITATAMMRLVDRGLLDLDAPLGTSIDALPEASRSITPRQLASHTSGIRHYALLEIVSGTLGMNRPRHYSTVADGLESFISDRLKFAPGTDFLYSTWGYSLLSRKLELASGSTFPRLLDSLVFEPCGMQDTTVDGPAPMKHRATFYQAEQGHYSVANPMDTSNRIAGGGLVSTPSDMVRLGLCAAKKDFLSQSARTRMWTPVLLADGRPNPQNYALGWRVDTSVRLLGKDKPTHIIHHGGIQEGGVGFLVIAPDLDITVAVMSNSGADSAREAVQEVAYELARQLNAK